MALNWYSETDRWTAETLAGDPDYTDSKYFNVKAKWDHDINVSYDITDAVNLYAGVNNLFDEQPEFGYSSYPISAMGRYFYFGAPGEFWRSRQMRKSAWRVAGLVLATFPALLAAAPTPVALDDYYLLADVSEPAFSPSGDRIAYTVSRNDKKNDESTSDIWSVPWSGGKPAQLTRTPKSSESQPRYSSDGKSLFFLSDAGKDDDDDEDEPPSCGACRRKAVVRARSRTSPAASATSTSRPTAIAPSWSLTSGRSVGSKAENPPPIEIDRFLFKSDGEGYLDDRTQQLFIVDLATGKARQLTSGQRDHWHPVWSPDGISLAYTAKERGETDRDSNYEVFVQRVDAGAPNKISTFAGPDNDPDWGARPAWSPDSRRVLWLEGGENKWIYYSSAQLAVADVATGEVTRPARIDRWFYYPRFAPDGSILALVEQDRDTWLARIMATADRIPEFRQTIRL